MARAGVSSVGAAARVEGGGERTWQAVRGGRCHGAAVVRWSLHRVPCDREARAAVSALRFSDTPQNYYQWAVKREHSCGSCCEVSVVTQLSVVALAFAQATSVPLAFGEHQL